MKQFVIFTFLIVISSLSFAQEISTKIGQYSRDINIGHAISAMIIDANEEQLLIITCKPQKQFGTGEYIPGDYMIMEVDTNLKLKRYVKLKNRNQTILAANTTKEHITLLFREDKHDMVYLTSIQIDKNTLTQIEQKQTHSIILDKNDEIFLWCKQSPNRLLTAITYIVTNKKKQTWNCRTILLDNNMNIIWDLAPKSNAINDIYTTNDSIVYLTGTHYDLKSKTTELYYEQISQFKHNAMVSSVDEILLDSYILNVINSKMIISGTTMSPSSKKDILIGGMYGITYNFLNNLSTIQIREFNHEDYCVIHNQKITKKNIPNYAQDLIINHIEPSIDGGVITAQYSEIHANENMNGDTKHTFKSSCTIAMKVLMNGDIAWEHPFRFNQQAKESFLYLNYNIITDEASTYLLQTEHFNSSPSFNNNIPIKKIYPTHDKANIALYLINANGDVNKQFLTYKSKAAIYGYSAQWFNNKYYLLIGEKKKCRLLTLERIKQLKK